MHAASPASRSPRRAPCAQPTRQMKKYECAWSSSLSAGGQAGAPPNMGNRLRHCSRVESGARGLYLFALPVFRTNSSRVTTHTHTPRRNVQNTGGITPERRHHVDSQAAGPLPPLPTMRLPRSDSSFCLESTHQGSRQLGTQNSVSSARFPGLGPNVLSRRSPKYISYLGEQNRIWRTRILC